MENYQVFLVWTRDGVTEEITFDFTESMTHGDISFIPIMKKGKYGKIYSTKLVFKKPGILNHLSLRFPLHDKDVKKMMVNGYQTWTQSKEMEREDEIPSLRWFVHHLLGPYGDYTFNKTPDEKGHFISWTYSYFRLASDPLLLVGSLTESYAYTLIDYDFTSKQLVVSKELNDLSVQNTCTPLQIYIGEGNELDLWEEYTSLIPGHRPQVKKCTGWTSWYNYYTEINEKILLDNLKALSESRIPLDVFQIDDGYQMALGDWLEVNSKFPSGMQYLANRIKEAGYRPGLWLAPFICDKKSNLYQNHPDWLLKDCKGKPVKAGWNPGWNGWFYCLDFYSPDFQDYLKQVLHTVLDVWGYEMVKLDFLYAVALQPGHDKSRGQIMTEALDFLTDVIGDRWILGCGVPLGPSFGRMDYCRIGSDVAPYWEDGKLAFVNYRERVSTFNSLLSTLGRWQLNQRVFLNDPDVFILRDKDNKLTTDERYTLFLINNLFGGLVFFSDHIGEYTPQQMSWLKSMYPTIVPQVKKVNEVHLVYQINFNIEDKEYAVYANLSNQPCKINHQRAVFIANKGYISAGDELILHPHQSCCMFYFKEPEVEPTLIGSHGHVFPAAQIKHFDVKGESVNIVLHENSSPETKVYIGSPLRMTNIKVNGKYYSVKLNNQGLRYVSLTKKELE